MRNVKQLERWRRRVWREVGEDVRRRREKEEGRVVELGCLVRQVGVRLSQSRFGRLSAPGWLSADREEAMDRRRCLGRSASSSSGGRCARLLRLR